LLPSYLKKPIPKQQNIKKIRRIIGSALNTVCESARCPNLGECFARSTLTFMILGDTCTRSCAFCAVKKGTPDSPDPGEARKIAEAVQKLNLTYVVITSVTRDDLPDGGAEHFVKVIQGLRDMGKGIRIEVLIPDFTGKPLQKIIKARPYVINHNLETVPRLYPVVRPPAPAPYGAGQADYQRSLGIIHSIKETAPSIYTKSGLMVGLGETRDEVEKSLLDLSEVNCDLVTIGQYLPPSKSNLPVERYVPPEEFEEYKLSGSRLGLKVSAGPFIRSSYHAGEML